MNRYRKYSSLIEQINSIFFFERDYQRNVLSRVYLLGNELEMIPKDMTCEEFESSFFDQVNQEEPENIVGAFETENQEIYQKMFHYPLSTQ